MNVTLKIKNNEFKHWVSFSPKGSGMDTCSVFWDITMCRVQISGRFGRVGSDFGLIRQSPT